jgi:uncharacterized Fe-S cluster-containing MiaB family protein
MDSIKNFTQTQNVSELENIIQCSCKEEWKSAVLSEKIGISDVSYSIQFS